MVVGCRAATHNVFLHGRIVTVVDENAVALPLAFDLHFVSAELGDGAIAEIVEVEKPCYGCSKVLGVGRNWG